MTDNLRKITESMMNDPELQERIKTEAASLLESNKATDQKEAALLAVKSIMNIDLTEEDINGLSQSGELSPEDLEQVAGGFGPGDEYNDTDEAFEYCGGDYANGPHEWVRTGNQREEPFFIFWTRTAYEYRCTKCGATKWES